MMRMALSPAAAALFRALRSRAAIDHDRILLIESRSVDWRSLTFEGEQHSISLRVSEPEAQLAVTRISAGLAEADLPIGRGIVADIAVAEPPKQVADGSYEIQIEALTLAD